MITRPLFFIVVIIAFAHILNTKLSSFPRSENQNKDLFWSAIVCTVLVACTTITCTEKDSGILNRNQTNEWKGWMQLVFLLYHYYRATWVYNEVRVLVSCYVWMTGFGNYIFFTVKKDFSFTRVLTTLIRINLLTLGLIAVNQTSMMLYYVVPLHTIFFLTTWATCWVEKVFKRSLLSLGLSLVFLVLVFEWWQPFEKEVAFRFGLDRYSAWWGMVCARIFLQYKLQKNIQSALPIVIGLSLCATWFVLWGHEHDKYVYNPNHPYIVILPISGYILIRNGHPILRRYYSKAMAWAGDISLETYVLQFHMLMCKNAEHILVLVPNMPVFNTVVVSILFFIISRVVRESTVHIQSFVKNRLQSRHEYLPVQQSETKQ